jgi:hypothetical protein
MSRDEEFEKWYEDYFCNQQGEDSPYSYNDVKIAFFKGYSIGKKMNGQKRDNIIKALNLLKDTINPALDNKIYQMWLKTNKKIKFRLWCIDKIKELILLELK